jgi:hypothetical protein
MTTEEIQALVDNVRAMTRDELDRYVHAQHARLYGVGSANDLMNSGMLEIRWYALQYKAHEPYPTDAQARQRINRELEAAGLSWPYNPQIPPQQRKAVRANHPLAA